LSEDKWRRIAPWIARHIVDLDAVQGDEITAGLVSMLLWGGGSTKASARRAQQYAERLVARLDDERSSHVDNIASMLDTMTQEARWCSIGNDERRVAYTTIDVRQMQETEGTTLYGYAAVFDSASEPMPFIEYVKRGAFAKTLERGADVRLLIDHEGVPLARTTSGTLRLHEDERGLAVAADLDPNNPDAMRVMSALKRGDLSQMSFAFRTIKDSWSDDMTVRELDEVDLFDVSVVTFPAYERTVAEIRSRQLQEVESSDNLGHQSIGVNVRRAQLALARLIR
jgi:HK97 family phage prohead protease